MKRERHLSGKKMIALSNRIPTKSDRINLIKQRDHTQRSKWQ
jgi:hypothetical protein